MHNAAIVARSLGCQLRCLTPDPDCCLPNPRRSGPVAGSACPRPQTPRATSPGCPHAHASCFGGGRAAPRARWRAVSIYAPGRARRRAATLWTVLVAACHAAKISKNGGSYGRDRVDARRYHTTPSHRKAGSLHDSDTRALQREGSF